MLKSGFKSKNKSTKSASIKSNPRRVPIRVIAVIVAMILTLIFQRRTIVAQRKAAEPRTDSAGYTGKIIKTP